MTAYLGITFSHKHFQKKKKKAFIVKTLKFSQDIQCLLTKHLGVLPKETHSMSFLKRHIAYAFLESASMTQSTSKFFLLNVVRSAFGYHNALLALSVSESHPNMP